MAFSSEYAMLAGATPLMMRQKVQPSIHEVSILSLANLYKYSWAVSVSLKIGNGIIAEKYKLVLLFV